MNDLDSLIRNELDINAEEPLEYTGLVVDPDTFKPYKILKTSKGNFKLCVESFVDTGKVILFKYE